MYFTFPAKTADYVGDWKMWLPLLPKPKEETLPFIIPGLSGGKKSPQRMDLMAFDCFISTTPMGQMTWLNFWAHGKPTSVWSGVTLNLIFWTSSTEGSDHVLGSSASLTVDNIIQIADPKPAITEWFERYFVDARMSTMACFLCQ